MQHENRVHTLGIPALKTRWIFCNEINQTILFGFYSVLIRFLIHCSGLKTRIKMCLFGSVFNSVFNVVF